MFYSQYLKFIRMKLEPRIFISLCNCAISSSFFIDHHIFVSSAYRAMCVPVLMPWCRSFMKRPMSEGPKKAKSTTSVLNV